MSVDHDHNPTIGIDLGTTFSAIAKWNGRGPEHYQTKMGRDTLQSVVYKNPHSGQLIVGETAWKQGLLDPDNLKLGVKRDMDDAAKQITIGGQTYTPIDLSSFILDRLYKDVVEKYPSNVFSSRGTVVTVPYYFKANQCENTRMAAELANINCIGLLQEPIAASLSYAWQLAGGDPSHEVKETILVFDLGGGTFDLTLFDLCQTRDKLRFEVMASGGDDRLGGMDFDKCLAQYLLNKCGIDLKGLSDRDERRAWQKLYLGVVEAKICLAEAQEAYCTIADVIPGKHIDAVVTRDEFEKCIEPYIDKIKNIIDRLWGTACINPSDVDRVILVGGSSKIPKMRQILLDAIGSDRIYANNRPDLCVAEGAALYAAYLDDREVFGREIEITTRTCHSLGVEISGGRFHAVVPANAKAPCERIQHFGTDTDDLTAFDINVYQGSCKMVADNTIIGTVNITGLQKKPKGELDIKVIFKVSEDQKLSVVVEADGQRKAAAINFA